MKNNFLNIKINGKDYKVKKGSTILEACRVAGIEIPTLCFLKDINEIGACRMCVVEVKGAKALVTSCVYPCNEGIEITTDSKTVIESRKKTLELLLSNHKMECLSCIRSGECELQTLCKELGVEDQYKYAGSMTASNLDESSAHMIRDNSKCILCRRCVAICEKVQGVGVIGPNKRGFNTFIGSHFDKGLGETSCISCGQCINVCPTGALYEKSDIDKIFELIKDPTKKVIVQTAPAVRAAIAEEFGYPIGTKGEGKMVAGLRRLGFTYVFDTDFAADLTIMEEAYELIDRIKNNGVLPMITSCSPGWIKYCEAYYPDLLPHLSTCKSPQQMFGAMIKTYFVKKMGWKVEDVVSVSVMPCTAKKFEIQRDDESAAGKGNPDLDYTMTTRELARMMKKAGINWDLLPEEKFDEPLGISTGAGVIFGASGGVMEAAIRTAVDVLTGKDMKNLDYKQVRGIDGIREATLKIGKLDVKVAITSSMSNAKILLNKIREGKADYHFIEIMGCPGGCINGGGQPQVPAFIRNTTDYRQKRAKVLYDYDKSMQYRKSHKNPIIKQVYKEFLEKPNSHIAHKILHTSYQKREKT
ncbi:MAG: NADH-dependent [FeFe] hydrogenase, group A6 [Eubacteriales bacterium]|nr:NADH-dependent [FeFe] hydrogenase, group A6 [Eubacteriales bacterium]